MKWSFAGKWIAGGFGCILLMIGTLNFFSYKNISELVESADAVQQTYQNINTLTEFYFAMTAAESGRRGYITSGSQEELDRHQAAVQQMESQIGVLQQQMHDRPLQQQRLARLKNLTSQRLTLFKQSIALYKNQPFQLTPQTQITERSVKLRAQIQSILEEIKSEEQEQLLVWLQQSHASLRSRVQLEITASFLSFAVIGSVYLVLYRQWQDRQQRQILEQSLTQEKEMGELKLRLFSMISHEFRTPLSVILASAQLLEELLLDFVDESKLKNLYRIQSSAKMLNQLLSDILTLTRAETGKLEFKPESLDIEAFCLNLIEDIQFLTTKNHVIKFISKGHYQRVKADEKLLYSILSNLLLNAVKYSPQGGDTFLILRCEPEAIFFQVKDEGIGIPLEAQPEIYQPFYRGQNVDNIVGTGLGLAVVKSCLELHGGEISVESQVGMGTTFTVKIPAR